MTVVREVVKLGEITPAEWAMFAYDYPPEAIGMTFNCYEWKVPMPDPEIRSVDETVFQKWLKTENECIVEIGASDSYLTARERKGHRDILLVLGGYFRNKIKQRQLTHPDSPQTMLGIQAPLNHPIFKSPETPQELRRKADAVKEKDIHIAKYTREELRNSPHPELHPVNIRDKSEGEKLRRDMRDKMIAMPDGHSTGKRMEYVGGEKGYKEVDDVEYLEYKFATIEKG